MLYLKYFKRLFDLIISTATLIIISPFFVVIGILVRVKIGSPILFRQKRPGLNEKIFVMYKFRTMTNEKDQNGNLLPDELRLTKFGQFLRSTSLDELPELLNIIKGDMSIVGPRPLLIKYLPYYTNGEKKRHDVKPGLTGLSQVNGRNLLKWSERFKMDVDYSSNVTFLKDIKIILLTVKKVFRRSDILVGDNHIMDDLDVERQKR